MPQDYSVHVWENCVATFAISCYTVLYHAKMYYTSAIGPISVQWYDTDRSSRNWAYNSGIYNVHHL